MRILLLALCLLCCALPGLPVDPPEPPPPTPGTSLAQMELFDLQGKKHRLAEVKSRRMVVVFWAFWCDTWKAALPHLQALDAVKGEYDCTIWSVSVDGTYTAEVRPVAGRIPFPLLVDNGTWRDRLGVRRVPTVMILNTERTVVAIFEGYPGNAVIESALRKVP